MRYLKYFQGWKYLSQDHFIQIWIGLKPKNKIHLKTTHKLSLEMTNFDVLDLHLSLLPAVINMKQNLKEVTENYYPNIP